MGSKLHDDVIREKQQNLPTSDMVKLIISDVDGTLLDSHHKLHPRTFRALKYLRLARPSLPIVIATGKQRSAVGDIREPLQLQRFPASHLNGNVVYKEDAQILKQTALEPRTVMQVLDRFSKLPEVNVIVYDQEQVYTVQEGNMDFVAKLRGYGEKFNDSLSPAEVIDKIKKDEITPVKMAVNDMPEKLDDLRLILSEFPKDAFTQTQALPFCIELIPSMSNKGTALNTLLSELYPSIKAADVLTFGDGENDLSMFRVAGWSVGMISGMPVAQQEARGLSRLGNDEGGVGEVLERIFSIPEDFKP